MNLIRYITASMLLFALSGCVYEPGPGYPVRPGYSQNNNAYNTGFDRGRQDARNNRPRSPERWIAGMRGVNRNQFIRGYNEGYDRERPSLGDARRYYRNGLSAGENDARRGLSRNQARHHAGVPVRYRGDFNRGYFEGYDRHQQPGGEDATRFERRGRDAAQRDQRRNLSYQPSRHYSDVPARYRRNFDRGYQAGWRGPRR